MVYSALVVLADLSNLFPLFKKNKVSNCCTFFELTKLKEMANFVVSTLCKYIEFEHSATTPSKVSPLEDLVIVAYYAIVDWIMVDQWIIKERETLKKVFKVIEIGMGFAVSKVSKRKPYFFLLLNRYQNTEGNERTSVIDDTSSKGYLPPTTKIYVSEHTLAFILIKRTN